MHHDRSSVCDGGKQRGTWQWFVLGGIVMLAGHLRQKLPRTTAQNFRPRINSERLDPSEAKS
jgi:hypothetical protein